MGKTRVAHRLYPGKHGEKNGNEYDLDGDFLKNLE
jgi:hypothetical protein